MNLLDDVKQKLTDKEYTALVDECKTIHNGEASITVGRGPDGRERTLYKSSFEKIIEFNAKLSLARALHRKISELFEKQRNPEVDNSIERELNELRDSCQKRTSISTCRSVIRCSSWCVTDR